MIGNLNSIFKQKVIAGGGTPTYDADAQAYFNANTTITSSADKNAINTFYLGLKSDGIYTKIKAMYLPLWSTATNNKWNLVNPLDTDAAFRLTFATGMTFTSSGMTSNGTSGYADTFYNQIAQSMNLNSNHLSYYSRTSNTGSNWEIGCTNLSPDQHFNFALNYLGTAYYSHNQAGFNTLTPLATTGLYMSSRTASNLTKFYRNGTSISSVNFTPLTGINRNVWICGRNSNLTKLYSNRQCSFASIGDGLTDTDASNFYTRLNTLMTYFGINV
jgi:hypothetical protein